MIKRTILIQSPCHAKCTNDQLVLTYKHVPGYEDKPDKSVPIEDIGVLVLEHQQVSITHYLLNKLTENNTAVIVCNSTHHPTGLLMPLESNTLQSERFREQIDASAPLKKQLWQQTVAAKITNQAAVLAQWQVNNKLLLNLAAAVKSGDTDNVEGTAAVYYWQNIFPPAWLFYRKREGSPPNNLLNYGYAILRATMARALVAAGLLPTLGIFHRNRYNAYCLADDIMEPYRPFVDAIVRGIIQETSVVQTLTTEFKTKLLNVLNADVWLDGQKSPLLVAMGRTAVSLSRCYAGEQRKILYPSFS